MKITGHEPYCERENGDELSVLRISIIDLIIIIIIIIIWLVA